MGRHPAMLPQTAVVEAAEGGHIAVILPMVIRYRGRLYQLETTPRGGLCLTRMNPRNGEVEKKACENTTDGGSMRADIQDRRA